MNNLALLNKQFLIAICMCLTFSLTACGEDSTDNAIQSIQLDKAKTEATGWVKNCTGEAEQNQCELIHAIRMDDGTTSLNLATVALGSVKEGKALMAVTIPLGSTLLQGVMIQVDDSDYRQFPIRTCHKDGCIAYANIQKDFIDLMKSGQSLNIRFPDGGGKNIQVQMDLKDFTALYASL